MKKIERMETQVVESAEEKEELTDEIKRLEMEILLLKMDMTQQETNVKEMAACLKETQEENEQLKGPGVDTGELEKLRVKLEALQVCKLRRRGK